MFERLREEGVFKRLIIVMFHVAVGLFVLFASGMIGNNAVIIGGAISLIIQAIGIYRARSIQ